ncbi:hypothetical protein [Pseudonocardia phyllosphaerae]|uniref:hypothetical protein n=1 Tax=Pseudonocardia phyllosphaerae TaxID=3390502 RepID=UPI00397C89DE
MRRMTRAGLRGIGLLAATGALCAAAVVPVAGAAEPDTTWQPDLAKGEGTGIVVGDGSARFDRGTAHGAPASDANGDTESSADPSNVVPTGLLTLPARDLDAPTREIDSTLDADLPPGSTATVDVRGRRADGAWTEWIPAASTGPASPARAELPVASREVQGRLVLTSTGGPAPTVHSVTLSAAPASLAEAVPDTESASRSFSVFATREGLVGGTTANGHRITDRDRFVALPSRRALSADGKSDYSVKICAPNGRCAFAPVWDIGPWNTQDDYWNAGRTRERFADLPQGMPQASAAYRDGHNGGRDQFGRKPANPAGIDLGDGIFWDALGLKNNSQVQVDYLWTGSRRLSAIRAEGSPDVPILSAPRTGASVVGMAADSADVPLECVQGTGAQRYVQIGDKQYVRASAVRELPADLPACGAAAPAPATSATPAPAASATPAPAPAPATAAPAPATSPAQSPANTPAGEQQAAPRIQPGSAQRAQSSAS